MSEPKKQMRIETAPETAQDTAKPERAKRKGLPADGEPWKASEHDMVVMGRLSRAIEGVPPAAMRRIAPWFTSLLSEAMRDPKMVDQLAGQLKEKMDALRDAEVAQSAPWNPIARAYGQG